MHLGATTKGTISLQCADNDKDDDEDWSKYDTDEYIRAMYNDKDCEEIAISRVTSVDQCCISLTLSFRSSLCS